MELNYVYRQYDDYYVGHLVDFPEYDTQGKTIAELEEMLKSLYADLMSFDNIPLSVPYQHGVLELA
jgi:predicted RNase H-like HicB family nuclease